MSRINPDSSPTADYTPSGPVDSYRPIPSPGGDGSSSIAAQDYSAAMNGWLNANDSNAYNDPIYNFDQTYWGDNNLECTQYINDQISEATGFNLAEAVGKDMQSSESPGWHPFGHQDPNGYDYPRWGANSGANTLPAGSLLESNWENYFKRHGAFHPTDPNNLPPSGLKPGDILMLENKDPKTGKVEAHVALVKQTDAAGHPTQIAESTGLSDSQPIKIKSWSDFQKSYQDPDQNFKLVGYGRPADLSQSTFDQNNASLEEDPPVYGGL